ncbi:hypothetical protein Ancab_022318 [Ancistrocladus abbreviatus]
METLVVVAEHRNQYCSSGKTHSPGKFGVSPSRGFRDINCRAFESGAGLLPTPWKAYETPVLKRALSSPETPAPCANSTMNPKEEDGKPLRKNVKSSPISINLKGSNERAVNDNASFSELWAGPAYSNSPPPSSLPIPKFSLKPKRTVSLELPGLVPVVSLHPIAKSAPASPTRALTQPPIDFFRNDDSATKTLRRILNLDICDD